MENIQMVLDGYFAAWNEGFISKNGDAIRNYMSPKFVGYWAHANLDKPDEYGYNYDLDEVLKQYGKAEKSFEALSVTERKDGSEMIVVGRETNLINNEPYRAQCLFIWRNEEGEWKLLREYIELER